MFSTALAPTALEGWLQDHPTLPGLLLAALCLLILVMVILPRLGQALRRKGHPVLDPIQADELMLGSGALVVDLRSAEAFKRGHIRGSLHIPFPELSSRFRAPDAQARRPLILVDEAEELSILAYDVLVSRGFDWLFVLKGGMKAWRRANRPVLR